MRRWVATLLSGLVALSAFAQAPWTNEATVVVGNTNSHNYGDWNWQWLKASDQYHEITLDGVDPSEYELSFKVAKQGSGGQTTYIALTNSDITVSSQVVSFTIPWTNIPPRGVYNSELWGSNTVTGIRSDLAMGKVHSTSSLYDTDDSQYPWPDTGFDASSFILVDGGVGSNATITGAFTGTLDGYTSAEFLAGGGGAGDSIAKTNGVGTNTTFYPAPPDATSTLTLTGDPAYNDTYTTNGASKNGEFIYESSAGTEFIFWNTDGGGSYWCVDTDTNLTQYFKTDYYHPTLAGVYNQGTGPSSSVTVVEAAGGGTTAIQADGDVGINGSLHVDEQISVAHMTITEDGGHTDFVVDSPQSGNIALHISVDEDSRIAVPVDGAGLGMQMYRSVLVGANQDSISDVEDAVDISNITGIDTNFLDANTGGTGADLWVEDSVQIGGDLKVDGTILNQENPLARVLPVYDGTNDTHTLDMPTHDSYKGVTHPSVIYDPDGLDGYKFWAAYSGFPGDEREYSLLAKSHDGINWISWNGEGGDPTVYGDSELPVGAVFFNDPEIGQLEDGTLIYYTGAYLNNSNTWLLSRQYDPVSNSWSAVNIITNGVNAPTRCSSFVKEGSGVYRLYNTTGIASGNSFSLGYHTLDSTGTNSTSYTDLGYSYNWMWHGDVWKTASNSYHAIFMYNPQECEFGIYGQSQDGATWNWHVDREVLPRAMYGPGSVGVYKVDAIPVSGNNTVSLLCGGYATDVTTGSANAERNWRLYWIHDWEPAKPMWQATANGQVGMGRKKNVATARVHFDSANTSKEVPTMSVTGAAASNDAQKIALAVAADFPGGAMADGLRSIISVNLGDSDTDDQSNEIAGFAAERDGADNSGKIVFMLKNSGTWVDVGNIEKDGTANFLGMNISPDGLAGAEEFNLFATGTETGVASGSYDSTNVAGVISNGMLRISGGDDLGRYNTFNALRLSGSNQDGKTFLSFENDSSVIWNIGINGASSDALIIGPSGTAVWKQTTTAGLNALVSTSVGTGIKTSTPARVLHVNGDGQFDGLLDVNGDIYGYNLNLTGDTTMAAGEYIFFGSPYIVNDTGVLTFNATDFLFEGDAEFDGSVEGYKTIPLVTNASFTVQTSGKHHIITDLSKIVTCPTAETGFNFTVAVRDGDHTFEIEPDSGEAIWQVGASDALASDAHLTITNGWATVIYDGTYWTVQGE